MKGKSTSLAAFYRLSRNLLSTVFRDVEEPAPHEAEDEYWKIVSDKDVHMQVNLSNSSASIHTLPTMPTYSILIYIFVERPILS